jgi:rod shape-determining protein MreD
MGVFTNNIIRFVVIMALQIFFFNDAYVQGSTTVGANALLKPQFYILFILMLPITLHKNLTLRIAFVTGIIMDIFCNTYGLHASACVLLGLLRPFLIDRFFQTKLKVNNKFLTPSLAVMGFRNFFIYTITSTVIYNIYFYIIRTWSFKPTNFLYMLLCIVMGIITSEILFILAQAFFVNADEKKTRRRRR